jgi:predicted nucleotide-binding protein
MQLHIKLVLHQAIYQLADDPDIKPVEEFADKARHIFDDNREELISLLITALEERDDLFLARLKKEVEEIRILYLSDFVNRYRPRQISSRDSVAFGQGLHTPPHMAVLFHVAEIRDSAYSCENLAKVAQRAGSHLARQERNAKRNQEIGTNVFIGHGRSSVWRDLKDLIQDRLGLPWDEFNRLPVAGITNITRLSQMLDDAAIAFLVMTAEDEQADGKMRARENVVHEAGLFQGKLGFTKAIVLVEDGCEEFSNIQGLGQIRFPQGNIKAVFEEIRRVLEREGIIAS